MSISFVKHKIRKICISLKSLLQNHSVKGYIFMLHRVAEADNTKLPANENMKVSPVFLDAQLSLLEKKYDLVSLKEAVERIKSDKKYKRKFVVFTMDDGYLDNVTTALPVFKKHNAPYTIFLTTNFPDECAVMWWYEVEELLLENDSIEVNLESGSKITYECKTIEQKNDVFMKLRDCILKFDQTNLQNSLNRFFSKYKIDWSSRCKELCLSWSIINDLKQECLVNIGGHTANHYALKALPSGDDVHCEVKDGIERIITQTSLDMYGFAYPYGSWNEVGSREIKVMKELKIPACLSYGGPCTKKSDIYALPRINFTKNFNINKLKFIEHEKIKY